MTEEKARTHFSNPETAKVTAWMLRNWDRFKAKPVTMDEYIQTAIAETLVTKVTKGKLEHIASSADLQMVEIIIGKRGPRAVDKEARTLWLLWRRGHIVGEGFDQSCIRVGDVIRARKPCCAGELAACFPWLGWGGGNVEKFCEEAIEFFTGEKLIGWEIVKR